MTIVKTGNPTIDDMFTIEQERTTGRHNTESFSLRIAPSKMHGVYKVAGHQTVYAGVIHKGKKESQHVFLTRGCFNADEIFAYRVPLSNVYGIDEDKKTTRQVERIVEIKLEISSTKEIYGKNTPSMSKEAELAKTILEKYLPRG